MSRLFQIMVSAILKDREMVSHTYVALLYFANFANRVFRREKWSYTQTLKDERYEIKVKNHLVRVRTNGKDCVSEKNLIILVVQILNSKSS